MAVALSKKNELVMSIEEVARAVFEETGRQVFSIDQFVEAGLGARTDVMAALRRSVQANRLDAIVEVRGYDGCCCWRGTPKSFEKLRPFSCGECEAEHDTEELREHVFLTFEISSAWMALIEANRPKGRRRRR